MRHVIVFSHIVLVYVKGSEEDQMHKKWERTNTQKNKCINRGEERMHKQLGKANAQIGGKNKCTNLQHEGRTNAKIGREEEE